MAVLVLAEHDNQSLKAATLNTIAAATKLSGDVDVLVAGAGCADVAAKVAALQGVKRVLVVDNAAYADQAAEPLAKLVVSLAGNYSHLLAPARSYGRGSLQRWWVAMAKTRCRVLLRCWMSRRSPTSWAS